MMLSYAQNFEDVMLERVFKDVEVGFFIDVGGWDPEVDSVTKHFCEKGWRGVNVEPIPELFEKFRISRAQDINLQVLVGAATGARKLYQIEGTGMSTMYLDLARRYQDQHFKIIEREIECVTLEQLCQQFVGEEKTIHFLKVDAEGAEREVLVGGDWRAYRPVVVLVEAVDPLTRSPVHEEWENLLIKAGYLFAYFDGLNRFYVREEDNHLLRHFSSPPNVFDDFISFSYLRKTGERSEITMRLQKEIETLRRSTSWRVTAPFRRISAAFDRLLKNTPNDNKTAMGVDASSSTRISKPRE